MDNSKFLAFRLGNDEYGIDIKFITSIIEKNMEITRVPRTPDYVKGVINLRGEIVPVMSVRKRLGMEEIDYGEETRIIIVKVMDIALGLIVDAVSEVLVFDETSEGNSSGIAGIEAEYASGVGHKGSRIIALLKLEKLTGIEEYLNGSLQG